MKNLLLGTTALFALASVAPALAADLPARTYAKAPYAAPVALYNWTGFYIGGHIGGDWRNNTVFGNNNGQFIAGVQGGADYQFAQSWVIGVEANYSFKPSSSNGGGFAFVAPGGAGLVTNNSADRGLGSVTGRLGWTWGPSLLYVKGGYGFRDNSNNVGVTVAGAAVPFAFNRSQDGYTVGAGVEYMFTQNWSGKLEYQYYNFGNSQFTAGPAALVGLGSFRSNDQTFKAGINYRFNMGGPIAASRY